MGRAGILGKVKVGNGRRSRAMAMRSKVFSYHAELRWQGGHTASVSSGSRPELPVSPPEDFSGGEQERWSPEHLYLAAIQSCTMLSFLAHCAHNDLTVQEYSAATSGSIERRTADHRYAFSHVEMEVRARMAPGQSAAAQALTGKAERDCFITASTTAAVAHDWQITE
jgi:organic hydroperoxide reductase OsmC/OhrA